MIQAGKKGLLASTLANRTVEPLATDFDGTNDYLSRSSDLSGNSDGGNFTCSFWLYAGLGNTTNIFEFGTSDEFRIQNGQNGKDLFLSSKNTVGSTAIGFGAFGILSANTWNHVLISVDGGNSVGHLYVNDQDTGTTFNFTNNTIDFTQSQLRIMRDAGSVYGKGRLAHVFLDYTYRDLSVESNRRDFITADLKPAGSNSTLTGGIIYLPLTDATAPGTNDGTGGDFTLNGTVAQSGRGPNQYNPAASTFDGSNDYLSRSSALSGASDGKAFTMAFNIKYTGATFSIYDANSSSINDLFRVQKSGAGNLEILAYNSGGTIILNASVAGVLIAEKYHHVVISIDLNDTGSRQVFIDGVAASVTWSTYTNANITFTQSNPSLVYSVAGSSVTGAGEISDFWFDDSYTADLSGFYDTTTGKAKDLGVDGSTPTGSAPLIYLPMRGDDAGSNKGTGGDFTVNSGPYSGARGPNEFWAGSAEFNGTDQYLTSTALSGASDSKTFTFVAAFYDENGTTGTNFINFQIASETTARFRITHEGDETIYVEGRTAGDSVTLQYLGSGILSINNWHTILVSVDLSNTGKRHIYANGSAYSGTWNQYFNNAIDFTMDGYAIAADFDANGLWDGKIGFLWFNTEYIDFSQEANRLKFFDAFGYPVDVGADGSLPTGNQPLIYMNNGFHLGTNLGSGGNFTPQNTPTDGGFVKG